VERRTCVVGVTFEQTTDIIQTEAYLASCREQIERSSELVGVDAKLVSLGRSDDEGEMLVVPVRAERSPWRASRCSAASAAAFCGCTWQADARGGREFHMTELTCGSITCIPLRAAGGHASTPYRKAHA
jgi:hypothetical protein